MSKDKKRIKLNIETLVLVAVWEKPFIFQGCFKVKELHGESEVLFFFRCQSSHIKQIDILHYDFSPHDYEFTHLYNELGLIQLKELNNAQEDALYALKYALHITLGEMLSSRAMHFTSIDDMAMQAMIHKITPILNGALMLPEESHIGFAVAMDFCPKGEAGQLAVLELLNRLKNQDAGLH